MQMGGFMGGLFRFSEWAMKLAYLNILWILFSILGFGVFGVMPATVATFTIARKWLKLEEEIPIGKTFFSTYKKEFVKSNVIGFILAIIGMILYVNYQYLHVIENPIIYIVFVSLNLMMSFFCGILCLYIVPVYVHFDLKLSQYFKYALMIGIMNIHLTIIMVVSIYLLYLFLIFIPGLIPVFVVSMLALVIMGISYYAFLLLEKKSSGLIPLVIKGLRQLAAGLVGIAKDKNVNPSSTRGSLIERGERG
ncbi:putative membrane protein YesL [Neobacillus niacini]|uniref:YesL family protein n=1 Tax=Neobacillus driksii TaxID=3035913 RepID=UPI00277E6C2C|nr:YesL family protein [Neobacillus niacini]MDQ0974722.1 putative membrane protein YesL [Neobacillus niacini]